MPGRVVGHVADAGGFALKKRPDADLEQGRVAPHGLALHGPPLHLDPVLDHLGDGRVGVGVEIPLAHNLEQQSLVVSFGDSVGQLGVGETGMQPNLGTLPP